MTSIESVFKEENRKLVNCKSIMVCVICGQKNIIMEFIWWFGGNSVSLQQSFTNDHEQNNSTTDHALPDGDTAHAGC